jgi:hypothetical protein
MVACAIMREVLERRIRRLAGLSITAGVRAIATERPGSDLAHAGSSTR